MTVLPEFDGFGLLPPGEYPMTLEALSQSLLVNGPNPRKPGSSWNAPWRRNLVVNLSKLVNQLWFVGITDIFIDGSFVEDKDRPNDIDGYFVCDFHRLVSGELARDLNQLDPHKVWTWDPASRKRAVGFPKKQLPMWLRYRVELYPHAEGGPKKILAMVDEFGNPLEFPAAFRKCRSTNRPKGIVKIIRSAK